jgi:hypothetical protein
MSFSFSRSIPNVAAPCRFCSVPPQPPAASPLPLPVGLSGRIRASARFGSWIQAGPPGPARAVTSKVTVATPGRYATRGRDHRPLALLPGPRPYVSPPRSKQVLWPQRSDMVMAHGPRPSALPTRAWDGLTAVLRQTGEAHWWADFRPPYDPTFSSIPPLARVLIDIL